MADPGPQLEKVLAFRKSLEYTQEVTKAKAEAEAAIEIAEAYQNHAEAQAARADQLALELAEQAADAAQEGRVEQARQMFAKAHEGTTNLDVLSLAHKFYHGTGDLKAADDMLKRWLAIRVRSPTRLAA
jgi:hypothetical protein